MDEQPEQTTVYGPGDAAQQLGVAPATLRRYAGLYGAVFEELATDKRGAYLYTAKVLERLSAAKAMQEQGQAVSLEQALLMLRDGVQAPAPLERTTGETLDVSEEARAALMTILRDELRAVVREEPQTSQEGDRRVLGEELRAIVQDELRAVVRDELQRLEPRRRRPWWRWWR